MDHSDRLDAQVEFAVEMKSPCCVRKVEKALKDIPGVKSFDIKPSSQIVMVRGNFVSETVRKIIEQESGMYATVMGQGTAKKENFGSGMAAISIGMSPVRGIIRMTQLDKETCVIEGTIDGFSKAKDVCVSLHECGDTSDGCASCGSPYKSDEAKSNCDGIINSSSPRDDGTIEFRMATSQLKLADMIGRAIVVHEGSEKEVQENKSKRLACGIVARSSGLFQNTKRFCACDGVTIWEEKKRMESLNN